MKTITHYIPVLISLILIVSCADFLDVNDNPNAPVNENLVLSAKLPAAQLYGANLETGTMNQLGALWSGYWGNTTEGISMYRKERTYNGPAIMAARDGIPLWENGFQALLYYQLIREQAETENAMFYQGIAQIMQAWHFMRLVDIYGDIPFDEALQGTRFPEPAYENGEQVYKKSLDLIMQGIENIQNAPDGSSPGVDDIMFGGNKDLWVKFANTTVLRALLRQSELNNSEYVLGKLALVKANGYGFLSEGEHVAVQPGFQNIAGKMNPFWSGYYKTAQGVSTGNHIDIRPTQYAIEQYSSLNDPRLETLYAPSVAENKYRGVHFGDPNPGADQSREFTSAFLGPAENGGKPGALFKSPLQASMLMGSFESFFLQAEAAMLGWLDANASELYVLAITESMNYMEVVDAARIESYLQQPEVQFNSTKEQLIQQKWLALNSIGSFEAWCDYRRLGLPDIPNSLSAPAANARPQRLMYPETEVQSNGREVEKRAVSDITKARVWWMN